MRTFSTSGEAGPEALIAPFGMNPPSPLRKVSIRFTSEEIRRLDAGAAAAGLSRAAFFSQLLEGSRRVGPGRRPRMELLVSAQGKPEIRMLDEAGKVVKVVVPD